MYTHRYTAALVAVHLLVLASCGTQSIDSLSADKAALAKPTAKPVAVAAVYPTEASAPVLAHFSATGSSSAEGTTIVKWEWNFGGKWEDHTATGGEVWRTFLKNGTFVAHLRVIDSTGKVSQQSSVKLAVRAGANAAPVALTGIATANGTAFQFDASESYDPDGTIVLYEWDFDNDGDFELTSNAPTAGSSFSGGDHTVLLRVTDNRGATGSLSFGVTGNFAPNAVIEVVHEFPGSGERNFVLSFAGSNDVEGPIFDAVIAAGDGPPEPWDINTELTVSIAEGDEPWSLVLTVRDGLWATDTALASISYEDGVVIALP